MLILVFGNEDLSYDNAAIKAAKLMENRVPGIYFKILNPNEDLDLTIDPNIIIMDVVWGIERPLLIENNEIEKFTIPPRGSVHDFDLAFQLKYLKKLGKLENVKIIGLPMGKEINYDLVQSILRKLVAQDMQGS